MPRAGSLWVFAVREALGVTYPVGSLPIQVRCRFVRACGRERNAAAIRCPYRLRVTGWVGRKLGERVPRPVVHPYVELGVENIHGEAATLGSEERIEPVRGRRPQRR